MTNEEIKAKVIAIIVDKLGVDANEVKLTSHLSSDLGADSLDQVELIMEFEKDFGIQIPEGEAKKIETIDGVLKYLVTNLQREE